MALSRTAYFPISYLPDYENILARAIEDNGGRNFERCGVVAEHIANTLCAANIPAFPWLRGKYWCDNKDKTNKYAASDEDLRFVRLKLILPLSTLPLNPLPMSFV